MRNRKKFTGIRIIEKADKESDIGINIKHDFTAVAVIDGEHLVGYLEDGDKILEEIELEGESEKTLRLIKTIQDSLNDPAYTLFDQFIDEIVVTAFLSGARIRPGI